MSANKVKYWADCMTTYYIYHLFNFMQLQNIRSGVACPLLPFIYVILPKTRLNS